jgi:hypothetical protein
MAPAGAAEMRAAADTVVPMAARRRLRRKDFPLLDFRWTRTYWVAADARKAIRPRVV